MTDQNPAHQHTAHTTALKKPRSTTAALVRRRFNPDFIAEIHAQLREAFGLSENDTLPDVFRVPVAVPLKIGIKQDLQNRYGLRDPKHPPMQAPRQGAEALLHLHPVPSRHPEREDTLRHDPQARAAHHRQGPVRRPDQTEMA